MPGGFKYPQSWFNTIFEKKENTGSQMGHTKKYLLKKKKVSNLIADCTYFLS
jgi:hypothetical protein